MQNVTMAGATYEFSGETNDVYFQSLNAFAAGSASLVAYVERFLAIDAVCLDIGANIGLTTTILAQNCRQGRICAFEPSPVNARHLRDNITRNALANVEVIEAAVGAETGTVNFTLPDTGAYATVIRTKVYEAPHAAVPLLRLDDWAGEQALKRLDFVKIDVEGFEADVLRGGATTIAAFRPIIYIEFNSVTTIMEARLNPLELAEAIWSVFDVYDFSETDGLVALTNPRAFVFDNLVKRGGVCDIIIRLKKGISPESLVAHIPRSTATNLL